MILFNHDSFVAWNSIYDASTAAIGIVCLFVFSLLGLFVYIKQKQSNIPFVSSLIY